MDNSTPTTPKCQTPLIALILGCPQEGTPASTSRHTKSLHIHNLNTENLNTDSSDTDSRSIERPTANTEHRTPGTGPDARYRVGHLVPGRMLDIDVGAQPVDADSAQSSDAAPPGRAVAAKLVVRGLPVGLRCRPGGRGR